MNNMEDGRRNPGSRPWTCKTRENPGSRPSTIADCEYQLWIQAVGNLTTGLNYTGEPCTSSGVQVLHQYSFHPQVGHHAVYQASFKLNNIAI
jgi:hypothetical protein